MTSFAPLSEPLANFTVPPPFQPLIDVSKHTFTIPDGFSCVRWNSQAQIAVACVGGCLFGMVATFLLKKVIDPATTTIRKRISWKLPSEDKPLEHDQAHVVEP